jgi:hypothetical protein
MAVLSQCSAAGALAAILRPTTCNLSGGISQLYIARVSDLDLTAMSLPANFNPTTRTLLNFVMLASATFKTVQTDANTSTVNTTFENGLFTIDVISYFEGHSCANDLIIENIINSCNFVIVVETNNCGDHYILGLEWTGTALRAPRKGFKVPRTGGYTRTQGTETDIPSTTMNFQGKQTHHGICLATTANVPFV